MVPEKSFSDPLICNDHGYAEGKFVAERLIDYATGKGLQATIIRSGQLSGSTSSGHWSATEFAPTLFRSSCVLNALPDELPVSFPQDPGHKHNLIPTFTRLGYAMVTRRRGCQMRP